LWQQIKRLRSDMWIEKHIIRPYLAFDSTLCEALQHNLQSLVPPPHHPSTLYPLPTVIFRWAELSTVLRICIDPL
jgi:nuclear cap-binding protein subunit 1